MKEYDIIIIGSGAGLEIVDYALNKGLKVALVAESPLGGTCLNYGCIPSKMLIYPADVISLIESSKKLGIIAELKKVEFKTIMNRMKKSISESLEQMNKGIENVKNLDFYNQKASFVKEYTLKVGEEKIKAEKIIIASGARPLIPSIKGIEEVNYLTNESLLELEKRPKSIIIIGGGYVGCEYAHFFASIGSEVIVVQRNKFLVPEEEEEISELLKKEMKMRMRVLNNTEALRVKEDKQGCVVTCKNNKTGKKLELKAERILIAVGRKSNADLLEVEKCGLETDSKGFIKVNEFFETSKKNIWAFGDAVGKQMFRHAANEEAGIVARNVFTKEKQSFNFNKVPHAVYCHPQIASVGFTEKIAKSEYKHILVGKSKYSSVAKGEAMMEDECFAKAIVDGETNKIVGFHIIGPHAPILIQEVINNIAGEEEYLSLFKSMHIHPALPELIISTLASLE